MFCLRRPAAPVPRKKGFLQETGIPAGLLFYAEMGSQAKSLSKIPFVPSAVMILLFFVASGG